MTHFLLTLLLSGLFLYLVASLAPGVQCDSILSAMLAVLVYSLLMGALRPTLLETAPAWRGLASLVLAALGLWASGLLVPGFTVNGLSGGVAGVLTICLLQLLLLAAL